MALQASTYARQPRGSRQKLVPGSTIAHGHLLLPAPTQRRGGGGAWEAQENQSLLNCRLGRLAQSAETLKMVFLLLHREGFLAWKATHLAT